MRRSRVGDQDHAAGRITMSSNLRQIRGLAVVILAAIWTCFALVRGSATASVVHVVRPGETLYHIARDYGTTVELLVALNQIDDPNRLRVGQRLLVSTTPTIHLVQRGDTLWDIARTYGVTVEQLIAWNGVADPSRLRPGQELIVSAGSIEHRVRAGENVTIIAQKYGVTVQSLVAVNNLVHPDRIFVGQTLIIPPTGGGAVEALAPRGAQGLRRRFDLWPVQGTVSSEFGLRSGRMHEGIDIAAPHGTPVRAVAAGTVSYADWAGSYGLLVKIDHGGGIETRYAHNSRLAVKPGDKVKAGQIIAQVGSTGRSTGPHLHFEVRVNGEAVDPRQWLR